MSIVYAVLRNELSRLAALRRKYHEERKLLPVGSVCVKKKSARVYAYLAHRENGRVVQRYLGRDHDPGSGKCGSSFRNGGSSIKRSKESTWTSRESERCLMSDDTQAFVRLLRALDEAGLLRDVLIIGTWCQVVYRAHFDNPPELSQLRTFDVSSFSAVIDSMVLARGVANVNCPIFSVRPPIMSK